MSKVIVDTNVLFDRPEIIDELKIVLPSIVLEEIDNLKFDRERGYKARMIQRKLFAAKNVEYVMKDHYFIPNGLDIYKNDNKIISFALESRLPLLTNDICMTIKARQLGVDVRNYLSEKYTGICEMSGNTDEINNFFEDVKSIGLLNNQYLIITNTDTNTTCECRHFDGELHPLILPPSTVIKGWNSKQRCALDLLNNKGITVKIIAGMHGSGKTKLSIAMGTYFVKNGTYDGIMLIRNPMGSGEDIGFLKGGFEDKTDRFFQPVIENLAGGEQECDRMINNGQLEKNIPFFIKGLTFTNKFILVDEAEDLDTKTLKLIGGRVGQNSAIVFSGDYKQAERKFLNENGLLQLIEHKKGDQMVGIVVFDDKEDDVRSETSKLFADL